MINMFVCTMKGRIDDIVKSMLCVIKYNSIIYSQLHTGLYQYHYISITVTCVPLFFFNTLNIAKHIKTINIKQT